MGSIRSFAPAAKPGGDLLFHRLSDSTIGAVRFHGRVRDGIGWVTDAMATKLWGRRRGLHQSNTLMESRWRILKSMHSLTAISTTSDSQCCR